MGIFNNAARDEEGNELRRRRTDQIPFSIIARDMTVVGVVECADDFRCPCTDQIDQWP